MHCKLVSAAAVASLFLATATAAFAWSVDQGAFLNGFNGFAQTNRSPARMKLKFTNVDKIGKFVFEINECVDVTALSKAKNETINGIIALATDCAQRERLDYFILLGRYLVNLTAKQAAKKPAEDSVIRVIQAVAKDHAKQSVTAGDTTINIEFSDLLGIVVTIAPE